MTRLYFFFLLLAGLFGGIGIFCRNKGKKKKKLTARQNRGGLLLWRWEGVCKARERQRVSRSQLLCACPSLCHPLGPAHPYGHVPCGGIKDRQVLEGGLSSSISSISIPSSLSTLLRGDQSLWHHPGRGEPWEDAAHPRTTSTSQPSPSAPRHHCPPWQRGCGTGCCLEKPTHC